VRISAKGEYAIKAMVDLAMHDGPDLRPIQEIAERQAIPQRYLEHVLLELKRAGLLVSRRGSAGGYRLSRPPDQITVGGILRAVEGGSSSRELGGRLAGPASAEGAADLSELWRSIGEAVSSVVDAVTVEDLRRQAEERAGAARTMYHI